MEIDNVLDTVLNGVVFCFLGVLVWLYFREETDDLDVATDEEAAQPSPIAASSKSAPPRGDTSRKTDGRKL